MQNLYARNRKTNAGTYTRNKSHITMGCDFRDGYRPYDYRNLPGKTNQKGTCRTETGSRTITMISTRINLIMCRWHLRILGDGVAG